MKFFATTFVAVALGQYDYFEVSDIVSSNDQSRLPFENVDIAPANQTRGFIVGGTDYNRCRVCNGDDYTTCRSSATTTCDNPSNAGIDDQMVCEMRWEKEIGGALKFYSGCALKSSCQAQEEQNFVGSVKLQHQCASTSTLESAVRRRFSRSIKCTFCHKMGFPLSATIYGEEGTTKAETLFTGQESFSDNMETRLAAWKLEQDTAPWYTTEVASIF